MEREKGKGKNRTSTISLIITYVKVEDIRIYIECC
jgi:hypothetical protein